MLPAPAGPRYPDSIGRRRRGRRRSDMRGRPFQRIHWAQMERSHRRLRSYGPDALEKDRMAILKGCNPKQKFFALCRVFARTRESNDAVHGIEIVHVYLVRAITAQEWEKKTNLAKDERAAIKRGFRNTDDERGL